MTLVADTRVDEIREWLISVLPESEFTLSIASSDASFRRYFRVVQGESSWIVMDAPPEHEDVRPFVTVAEFLYQAGINVPHIYARDIDAGFLLLTDFGNTSYLSMLNEDTVDSLYKRAIDEIIKMQATQPAEINLPAYNPSLLAKELELFPTWFLQCHLNIDTPAWLSELDELLISEAQSQPQFFVHRDFHSRNLMLHHDNRIGIIDFQDAVVGPFTYDLVSLLRDCYIEWPQTKVDEYLDYYLIQAQQNGLIDSSISRQQYTRWFDLMGLQRHLKVLGIFCRLSYRDNKHAYLNDLPLTLTYVLRVTEQYPELSKLHDFLTQSAAIMGVK